MFVRNAVMNGNRGYTTSISVKKLFKGKLAISVQDINLIPSYNLQLLIGIIGLVVVIIIKKK